MVWRELQTAMSLSIDLKLRHSDKFFDAFNSTNDDERLLQYFSNDNASIPLRSLSADPFDLVVEIVAPNDVSDIANLKQTKDVGGCSADMETALLVIRIQSSSKDLIFQPHFSNLPSDRYCTQRSRFSVIQCKMNHHQRRY